MNTATPVHLACTALPALLLQAPPAAQWMSAPERERLAAMQAPGRRDQFVASRWQARQLLARVLGGEPRDWPLTAPRDAPPQVAADPALFLSLSHSGGWAACALARSPLGLDLEAPQRRRDIAGLVALCCTPAEQALFDGLAETPRTELFYELWTVKESWLKRRLEWIAPGRLAQLDARVDVGGEVRTWSAGPWRLALCTAAAPAHWWTDEPAAQRGWTVADTAAAKRA